MYIYYFKTFVSCDPLIDPLLFYLFFDISVHVCMNVGLNLTFFGFQTARLVTDAGLCMIYNLAVDTKC